MELLQDAHIWVLFSFLIFLYVIWKFGKNKFLAILDSRIAEIRKSIEQAESLRVESQELLAQYQRKQRDAAAEAEEIIANAKAHAAEITKQAEKELKEISKRREQQLKERLERMEQDAVLKLRTAAADLAIRATAEIIAARNDNKTAEKLIDDGISKVGKQLAG